MQLKLSSAFAIGGILVTTTSVVLAATGEGCDTSPIQCCKDVELSGSDFFKNINSGLEPLLPLDPNVPIGINCTSILSTADADACDDHIVCCKENFSGIIGIACTPASF